jgi:surface polysaccharide O-acyltransferase-like enzyme
MNKELSRRLGILRFPLIVGIVFIHNYGTSVVLSGQEIRVRENSYLIYFIENLISMGVARTAVPLFFLISGYLFFYGLEWNSQNYASKLRSRASSLLVPFLFWNALTLAVMALAQQLPSLSPFFSGRNAVIAEYNWQDYVAALFGIGRAPISYQFWFIRDLMILVLATPLIHLLNQRIPALMFIVLFLGWFTGIGDTFAPSAEATLFFCAGCYLGTNKTDLRVMDQYGKKTSVIYLAVLVATTILIGTRYHEYLYRFGILMGVASVFYATKLVTKYPSLSDKLLTLSIASFFVYAAHEPCLTVMRKLAYKYIRPETASMTLLLYFTIPVILITLLLSAYFSLLRVFPKLTNVITGGR